MSILNKSGQGGVLGLRLLHLEGQIRKDCDARLRFECVSYCKSEFDHDGVYKLFLVILSEVLSVDF